MSIPLTFFYIIIFMQTIAATVTIHFMTYTYYYSQCVENNKDSFVSTQSELSLCIHSSLGTGIALLYLCYITDSRYVSRLYIMKSRWLQNIINLSNNAGYFQSISNIQVGEQKLHHNCGLKIMLRK